MGRGGMGVRAVRHSKAVIVIIVGACLTLALLTVFAIELSNNQAKSRRGISRGARAVRRSLRPDEQLIAISVQGVTQQPTSVWLADGHGPDSQREARHQNGYLALIGPDGTRCWLRLRGSTNRHVPTSRAPMRWRLSVRDTRTVWAIVLPYGKTGVIELAVAVTTPKGSILRHRLHAPTSAPSFTDELKVIPTCQGGHNYLLDGNGTVLAIERIPQRGRPACFPMSRRCRPCNTGLATVRRPVLQPGPL